MSQKKKKLGFVLTKININRKSLICLQQHSASLHESAVYDVGGAVCCWRWGQGWVISEHCDAWMLLLNTNAWECVCLINVTNTLKWAPAKKEGAIGSMCSHLRILMTPLIHCSKCMDASMWAFCSVFQSQSYIRPSIYITYMANAWLEMWFKRPLEHIQTQMRRKTHACAQGHIADSLLLTLLKNLLH